MSSLARIPMHVSASVRQAAVEVVALLEDYNYSPRARADVFAFTIANGTPTGCPALDPEDESDASAVFEAELEPVPFDSPAWDKEDAFLDAELLAHGSHPVPFAPEPPDAPDDRPSWSSHFAGMLARGVVPPIAGGSDEAEPYEPTAEDWADYRAWSDQLAARRFYAEHSLAEFNRIRPDDAA